MSRAAWMVFHPETEKNEERQMRDRAHADERFFVFLNICYEILRNARLSLRKSIKRCCTAKQDLTSFCQETQCWRTFRTAPFASRSRGRPFERDRRVLFTNRFSSASRDTRRDFIPLSRHASVLPTHARHEQNSVILIREITLAPYKERYNRLNFV